MSNKELTAKEEAFSQEYMLDLNATQAAIRAKYSKKTARQIGYENLTKPYIQDRISKLREKYIKATEIDIQFVLVNLKEVAERCLQRVPVMKFDRDARAMVREVNENGEGVWKFDASGATRSLELLGKHVGAFVEKKEPETRGFKITDLAVLYEERLNAEKLEMNNNDI